MFSLQLRGEFLLIKQINMKHERKFWEKYRQKRRNHSVMSKQTG